MLSNETYQQSPEKAQLGALIRQQLVNCVGFEGDELASSRKEAYDYYFQRPRGDETVGRSSIVTGDLSSMVEGNLAMMVEPLLDKRIAEFCAYDELDEEQAQLESDCVTEMLFKRQDGFIQVVCAIKDALLLRNCITKIYVDERTHKMKVRKSNVTPEIVPAVLDKIGKTEVHSFDEKTGTLSATITKETQTFVCEAIAPENFLVPKSWHRQDLKGIPFCAERHVELRGTLIERGFDKTAVNSLPKWTNPTYQAATDARLPATMTGTNLVSVDKASEYVEYYECYVLMDDGNGATQLHCISMSKNGIILDDDDEVGMVCYATGVAIINPHTFIGISLHDKLKSTQDSTTALTRALMDNLNTTTKNRTAHLDGIVEEGDVTDGRTNGSMRVNPERCPDVRMAVAAFAVPDTSANILANLNHFRQTRSEMGGATLDMATGQMQLSDRLGSQGLDRAYSVMEQLASFMTRIIANTLLRNMYLVAHETLRTKWQKPIKWKRGNQWVVVDPSKWPMRESVTVNIGKSLNERARTAAVLDALMHKQAALAQMGMEGILVDVDAFYAALMDWMRVNDLTVPEKYALDPRTPEAKQALVQRTAAAQKAAAENKQLAQQAVALEQLRVALEKYTHDSELQFKYFAECLQAQIEEAKLTTGAVVDIAKAREDARTKVTEHNARLNSGRKNEGSTAAADEPTAMGDAR